MNLWQKICLSALFACVSCVANASFVIYENNDEVTMVVTDESYTLTTDQTQNILYVALLDVFAPGGGSVFDSSRISGAATMSVNGGAPVNLEWWSGWQYRPGTQSPWTAEDVSFLFALPIGTLQAGDVITINGTLVMDATLDPDIIVPDVMGTVSTVIGGHSLYYSAATTTTLSDTPLEVGDTANFFVNKTFTNGDTGDVEVTLTCNAGLPLTQSFDISGDGGVTFTVTNLPDTGADCEVTESGDHTGYMPEMNGGDGCTWTGVTGGSYSVCAITNTPIATVIEVTANTEVDDPSIDTSATTTLTCSNVSPNSGPDDFDTYTATDTTGMLTVNWYAEPGEMAECTATMTPDSSTVEGDSCMFSFMLGDDEVGCDLEGTVFFEGIPTLSQYGLALLALLMLGVGFVGMRRFV